ncbi:sensor histidine kinase [Gordonia pseudamarae]|jgi:signal transduction histidine kinase|uniref:Sensor histidine kinase n=1 Tax=Gordonia pseudamarae TaxID=2831662 RepID=A0ABX6ILL4_9ACTN|nr:MULTISPECIES: sensor histidine kinase [Gordonia]MBD0023119.1 sensor histidine kinase [Gordonia sp. (in: high G+C Gram-positive bacteria)]QHN27250.1 sensor histidine kinase [Gordonia pseudamarae]QHN36133.1 sensor histidine kinase [Gordonia pseudamarae]
MPHSTLAPVFTGLRLGLHALLIGLAGFAVLRAFVVSSPAAVWVLTVGIAFVAVYLTGAGAARALRTKIPRRGFAVGWAAALTLLWAVLTWLSPEGAYLVFPLFFLYLHVLPGPRGVAAIVVTTAFAIFALGLHLGFSVGGVIGPLIGAGVALLIGLAYRALTREAEERERLLTELIHTRQQLADTEREQGALAERARLARDIHDTVAQGLSSIQMLLRAAERDTPEPGAGYLRTAREAAADSLVDTRQIIRELTPARLDDGLAAALRRLGQEQSDRASVPIEVTAEDLALPMGTQTALLRIAQGALSNAIRHANATRITIALAADDAVSLVVRDDGHGFDVSTAVADSPEAGSFGLHAIRERVEQLDGTLTITSAPGHGSEVTARLPLPTESRTRP